MRADTFDDIDRDKSESFQSYSTHLHHDFGGRIQNANPAAKVHSEFSRRQNSFQETIVNPIKILELILIDRFGITIDFFYYRT